MEKKRILISIYYMEIGGVERSLLGLLDSIDYNHYDVDLFIHRHTGEFMCLIPDKVNILPQNTKYATFSRPIYDLFKEGHWGIVLARLLAKVYTTLYIKTHKIKDYASSFLYTTKYTSPFLPSLYKYGEYDLAISFEEPHNIVRDKFQAKKKIAWIHTDYSTVNVNAALELPIWNSYDFIASISDSVTSAFLKTFPSLKDKIVMIENILSPAFVREQALVEDVSSEIPNEKTVIKLCSVGRYSTAKNFDNAPFICKNMIDAGMNIKWYIVGYGGDEALIKKNIEKAKMKERVILLGKKRNPYPYMQACDIYVQPSRYEGKAVTVIEAQILYKPIVITNFPTSQSQLTDGVDGVIVPMDNEGAAQGLKIFIEDLELQARLIANLHNCDFNNETEVKKIYKLI